MGLKVFKKSNWQFPFVCVVYLNEIQKFLTNLIFCYIFSALTDQTFDWADVSAGVAGTVAIMFAIIGLVFVVYDHTCRDYFREEKDRGHDVGYDEMENTKM